MNKKTYIFDIKKVFEYIGHIDYNESKEREITEAYDNDEDGSFGLSSRMIREFSSPSDNFKYDFIKTLCLKVLEGETYDVDTAVRMTINTGYDIALNTLINEGLIIEVENK